MHKSQQASNAFVRPARGSHSVRLITILTAVFAIAGILLLARSDVAAQSTGEAPKTAAGAPAGNAQHGKTIYVTDGCYECHGYAAQGGGGTGPKLGPNPVPYAAFSFQVRSPRDEMPPYTAKVLSDADMADIYAFVQSLPQPPKLDSIPLLK
jgi:mono/diheme cytochrome c family protein